MPNVILNINGKEVSGSEAVKQHSLNKVGPMDTTHYVTNVRIDVDVGIDVGTAGSEAKTATMTLNTLAQHYPVGSGTTDSERRLLGGSVHRMELRRDVETSYEREEGLWKVEKWMMKTIWREGDVSVL